MTRIATCQACNFIIAGIKSRKAIQHTCGKTAREIMEFIIRHQHEKALKNVKSISEITGWKMTNDEIVRLIEMQYYRGLIIEQTVTNRVPKEFIKPIQDLTRKDEREKVIGEIENWLNINGVDDYGNTQDYRDDLYCKLNSLKQ